MPDDAPSRIDPRGVEQLPGEPSGMLGPGSDPEAAETSTRAGVPAESVSGPPAGGVGDSPVRGTLVADGDLGSPGPVAALARQEDGQHVARAVPATSLQAKRAASLARVDDRIRRRATSIVDSALRAPELAELPEEQRKVDAPPPKGWTAKSRRIALDANNSMKSAPAYLAMAQRVVESYKKAEADRPQAPTINAEVVQVHVSVANYPRRRLSEE
jgi:hypothetical protein